ncbi:MAG: prolyl oligopeptidase family serine peptidase [Candidatus Shapirobacteria bacterium]|nr:prolyl oligopeptidase family serine peptidase [Candidatus Shapirobacteria bacterium]
MRRHLFLILVAVLFLGLSVIFFFLPNQPNDRLISPSDQNFFKHQLPKPLEKYSFENLRKREYQVSDIKLEKVLDEQSSYTSYLFSFQSDGKKVTGMANIPLRLPSGFTLKVHPEGQAKFPVIVMIRGYADEEIYFTGLGTRKGAGVFAENGFITLAPDFLGFGDSAEQSTDILEARFERPVTVLNLLASIKNLPQADPNKIFLWGHSNGGQIVLSVLEILPKTNLSANWRIPTVLWAPVTKGFPESVLQYMTDLDDQGLKVKEAINNFVSLYDPKKYSIDNYWSDISAPLQVHQGTADEYIKTEWTDTFVQTLKDLGKSVTYYKYPKNDHNFSRDWDTVVQRDLKFFKNNL